MDTPLPKRETLVQLVYRSLEAPRADALLERVDGAWVGTSSTQLLKRVEDIACAIRDAGLGAGDRVALIAADSVNWIAADFGILVAGCVVVPIFPTQTPEHVAFILENSEAKIVFTDTKVAAQRLRQLPVHIGKLVVFEETNEDSLAAFESRGAAARASHPDWPQVFQRQIDADDLAVLIYTSGTTGEPKGVMLTHYNIVFNAASSFSRAFDVLPPGSPVLSVLPFSHIYEHMIIYGYLMLKMKHYITHSVDELARDLREVRPVEMTAVPRIFERVLAVIVGRSKEAGGLRARLVPWALETGRRYMTAKNAGGKASPALWLQFRVAHALVLRKIRPLLGLDRLIFFVSGSAALHTDIAMTMLACDIPIVEGYGPTECSPVISVNTIGTNRYGTVGKPIPGVDVKIAPDGEILVRGPNVMRGYYKDETATAAALEGGWYHTGDIGTLDADGFLRITDRKNELFKTSGGKFIAPARVESSIKRSVYVNQAVVLGAGKPHPIALIAPNWDLLRDQSDPESFLTREVREKTADLAPHEQVWSIAILPRDLTVENGELSPSLKVKRRVVETRYAREIEQAYSGKPVPA